MARNDRDEHPRDVSVSSCTGPATPEQADVVATQHRLANEPSHSTADLPSPAASGSRDGEAVSGSCQAHGGVPQLSSCYLAGQEQEANGNDSTASLRHLHSEGAGAASETCCNAGAPSNAAGSDSGADATVDCAGRPAALSAGPADTTAAQGTGSAPDSNEAVGSGSGPPESMPVTPTTPLRPSADAPLLPPATDSSRMTLVLDLDGTLIASEDEPHAPVPFDYCVDDERFVWLRPGLRRFLDSVRPHFEVVLFTAAGESWATCALQRIDPSSTIFDSRLYRDHTVFHDDWPWVKDLSRLGRDLSRVVIVDDNPLMFMYQPDNALHVAAYDPQISGHSDDVLEQVLDVLMHKILPADDVREVLRGLKEPITASCVAARQAAARAAAASPLGAANGKANGAGSCGPRKAAVGAAGAHCRGADAGDASGASTSAADRALSGPPAQAQVGGGQGKGGRRGRRPSKSPQPLMAPQPQLAGPPVAQPATVAVLSPANAQHTRLAGVVPAAGPQQQQQPHAEKKQRSQRRRRGSAGSGGAERPTDAAPAGTAGVQAGALQPAALRTGGAAVASRQTGIVSRSWGQKQGTSHAALQQAAASALQQPEQQLQLKLKLLQLQREQEEEDEPGSGADADDKASAGAEVAGDTAQAAAAATTQGEVRQQPRKVSQPVGAVPEDLCPAAGGSLPVAATAPVCTPPGVIRGTGYGTGGPATRSLSSSCSGTSAAATCSNELTDVVNGTVAGTARVASLVPSEAGQPAGAIPPASVEAADVTRRGSRSARRRRRRHNGSAGVAAADVTGEMG